MSVPWRSGRDHKLLMGRASEMAAFIAVQRDHGHGQVGLDAAGEAEASYPLVDEVDRAVTRHAIRAMVQLHVAAGARALVDLHPRPPSRLGASASTSGAMCPQPNAARVHPSGSGASASTSGAVGTQTGQVGRSSGRSTSGGHGPGTSTSVTTSRSNSWRAPASPVTPASAGHTVRSNRTG